MTHEEMLKRAEGWLIAAEDDGDMESRFLSLAYAWLRLAEEVRKGSAPVSLDVKEVKP